MAFSVKTIAVTTTLTIAAAAGISMLVGPDAIIKNSAPGAAVSVVKQKSEYSQQALAAMAPEALIQMQKESLAAAREMARGVNGNVSEITELNGRPAFISPAEWVILKSVAERSADPEAEILRLVNLMRFNKQREALAAAETDETRKQLAEALLDQIPARVRNQELTKQRAQALQLDMISYLYTEKADVRERAAAEARRIGAGFDVKAS